MKAERLRVGAKSACGERTGHRSHTLPAPAALDGAGRLFRQLFQSCANDFSDAGIFAFRCVAKRAPLLRRDPHGNLDMWIAGRLERSQVKLFERQTHDFADAPERVTAPGAGNL